MTKKVKDAVKQVAAKVETLEKKNDKPVIAKPVIKPTQTRSDNDASEKNSDDDDVNDDNDNADDEDATVSKCIISTTGLAYYYFFIFMCQKVFFGKKCGYTNTVMSPFTLTLQYYQYDHKYFHS